MARVRDNTDQKAFKTLYDKYKGPMLSYVLCLVHHQSIAEEITQDVFLKVYRARSQYDERAKFSTWLWTIARNTSYDHLKKKKELLDFSDPEEGESILDTAESPLPDAEKALVEHAQEASLRDCIAKLSDAQRDALSARVFNDLSHEEIAATTGSSVAAVKSLIFRARTALLECLKRKERGHE